MRSESEVVDGNDGSRTAVTSDNALMKTNNANQSVRRPLRNLVHLLKAVASGEEDDDIELIHQLRTESRRADVALRLFADRLPRRELDWVRRRVGQIRAKSGPVRDMDVIMPLVMGLGDPFSAQAKHWLVEQIEILRTNELVSLKQYCQRLFDRGFIGRCRRLSRCGSGQNLDANLGFLKSCSKFVSRLATKYFQKVDLLKTDERQLHKVRILGRRLRYTLELLPDLGIEFTPESDADVAWVCRRLSKIQETLGQVHDEMSALRLMKERLADASEASVTESMRQLIDSLETSTAGNAKTAIPELMDMVNQLIPCFEDVVFAPPHC